MKPKKTIEEKAAESYFNVNEDNLKTTTEKEVKYFNNEKYLPKNLTEKKVKPISQEILKKRVVEKKYLKPFKKDLETIGRKRKATKKRAKKTTKKYTIPKIKLKENGYELIITEKPQAASKIANALGKAVQKNNLKVPYFEIDREGKKIVVVCAVGHLFTLKQNTSGTKIPTFDISWFPNYVARKKDFTKRYYDTILKMVKGAGSLTVATDFDIEGEVIGLNIVRFICAQKDASRMKFSTLTKDELNKSYETKFKHLKWGQAIAGETRHYLDWFYGINLSRALMNAIKTTGSFKIMSAGRVQGPALNLVVQKEKEIKKFKSEPYWQVFIKIDDEIKGLLELKHNKDIFGSEGNPKAESKLKNFENLIGKKALVETKNREQKLPPKVPFNLTNLQTEAYNLYGIKPSRTLQIAQSLYLAGLISYPRTSSQKLPKEIGYDKILKDLLKEFKVEKYIVKKVPIEGKKVDAAHPSIYPTGQKQILSGDEDKLYKLIAKRFLALFCDDAVIHHRTISAVINKLKFGVKGQVIKEKNWMSFYPTKFKEEKIPEVEGEKEILDLRTEEKETQPPKRYSQASIISELEKRNLGTKATRSSILETLYDRGYVEGDSVKATPLGISLIGTLEKYSPIIIDEELTRSFESELEKLQENKKKTDLEKGEKEIIEDAKKTITNIAKDFEKNEKKIGSELVNANIKFREQQKIENQLMICPKCGKGHLGITYSPKTKRFFIACDAYPDCKNTYSLPPNGVIKKTGKVCEKCGYPMLMRLARGRKPWIFCWNPNCETNAEWAKKREEAQKKEE